MSLWEATLCPFSTVPIKIRGKSVAVNGSLRVPLGSTAWTQGTFSFAPIEKVPSLADLFMRMGQGKNFIYIYIYVCMYVFLQEQRNCIC